MIVLLDEYNDFNKKAIDSDNKINFIVIVKFLQYIEMVNVYFLL